MMKRALRAGWTLVVVMMAALVAPGSLRAEPAYPATLEALVAKYPGATATMTQKTKESTHAVLQGTDAPDKVIDFYRAAVTAKGWEIAQESATAEAQILEATRDDHTFTVTAVTADGKGTLINLILTH